MSPAIFVIGLVKTSAANELPESIFLAIHSSTCLSISFRDFSPAFMRVFCFVDIDQWQCKHLEEFFSGRVFLIDLFF